MNPHTSKSVSKPLSVPCDQVGSLTLLGTLGQVATFMADNLRILDPQVFQRCMDAKFSHVVVTEPVNNYRKITLVIFQREFSGDLRNPLGLLKSARSKLHRVINTQEAECLDDREDRHSENLFEDEPDVCPTCGEEFNSSGTCLCDEDNRADYEAQQKLAQELPAHLTREELARRFPPI
jgi:hypothetical protein